MLSTREASSCRTSRAIRWRRALGAAANRCGPDLDATFQPSAGGDSAEPLRIGADSVASHTGRDRTGLDGLLWSSYRDNYRRLADRGRTQIDAASAGWRVRQSPVRRVSAVLPGVEEVIGDEDLTATRRWSCSSRSGFGSICRSRIAGDAVWQDNKTRAAQQALYANRRRIGGARGWVCCGAEASGLSGRSPVYTRPGGCAGCGCAAVRVFGSIPRNGQSSFSCRARPVRSLLDRRIGPRTVGAHAARRPSAAP